MQRQDNDIDAVNALTPLKAAFPLVLRLYQLALTLPCSINCVVRAFVFMHQESRGVDGILRGHTAHDHYFLFLKSFDHYF